jgi:hypothetical protein
MLCLPNYINSPNLAAITGGIITLFLFYLSSYSALLPVAVFVSLTVSYIIYYLMGGQIMCPAPGGDNYDNENLTSAYEYKRI